MVGWFQEFKQFIVSLNTQDPLELGDMEGFLKPKLEDKDDGDEENDPDVKKLRKMFMKELKFSGKIGDLENKNTMSYTSLCYQMQNARTIGYSNKEIINAVIKCINPSLELRAYLEGRTNLTYKSFITTLRSHYKEQDATSLFTTLSTTKQSGTETAQEFTMRLMTLKQKILFVSQEESSGYSQELIQERFLHTMLTGLKNDSVRTELRPLLKDRTTSDDELLESLTKAVADETEHQEKFNRVANKKSVTVSSIEQTQEKEKKENPIMKELNELKSQVMALTLSCQDLAADRDRNKGRHLGKQSDGKQNRKYRNRCDNCIKNGSQSCDHCFICQSSDHFSRGCKQRRQWTPIEKNGK